MVEEHGQAAESQYLRALAALHELIGSEVVAWLSPGSLEGGEPWIHFSGRVEGGFELGSRRDDAVVFDIAGVLLRLSERWVEAAWRIESDDAGRGWLGVGVRFRGGMEIELHEVPASNG